MALKNKQFLCDRLTARYGVRVDVGLHRTIDDVRDVKTGRIARQIVHEQGELFARADGVAVPAEHIAEETPGAEADEAAWLAAQTPPRDLQAEIDELKARNEKLEAALIAKSVVSKSEIDAAPGKKK